MKYQIISGGEAVKQIVLGIVSVYGFLFICTLINLIK